MKLTHSLAAIALVISAIPAIAAPAPVAVTIDFEGTTSFASISDFYNGGTGSSGNNYGVSFTGAATSLSNDTLNNYFSNAPSAGTVMFTTDSSAMLNWAQGFTGQLSFYYSSNAAAASGVTVYSGLNATGLTLASFDLNSNAQTGCTDTSFCRFDRLTANVSGPAMSIAFSGNPTGVAFDDITIAPVPEPSTYAMLALGLTGIGFVSRRRRSV